MTKVLKAEQEYLCECGHCKKENPIRVKERYLFDHRGRRYRTICYNRDRPDAGEVIILDADTECNHIGCNLCPNGNTAKKGIIGKGERAYRFLTDAEDIVYHQQCFSKELEITGKHSGMDRTYLPKQSHFATTKKTNTGSRGAND